LSAIKLPDRKRQPLGRDVLAADRRLHRRPALPAVNHSSTVPQYVPGMDETRILALRALRELLDDSECDDRDDLVACYRALRKAIAKNKPMKRKDRARVAERLRRLGWSEGAIGAATKPGPDLESSGGQA
jgi:hypothetical protein